MAMNAIATGVRNTMCDALVDALDAGTTDAAGAFNGHTAAYAALRFVCAWSTPPAFGSSASVTATANAITDDSSANATGTAAVGRAQDRDNATVFDFTIGTSGQDLNLNTVSITSGDIVSITSATITVPAS